MKGRIRSFQVKLRSVQDYDLEKSDATVKKLNKELSEATHAFERSLQLTASQESKIHGGDVSEEGLGAEIFRIKCLHQEALLLRRSYIATLKDNTNGAVKHYLEETAILQERIRALELDLAHMQETEESK